MSSSPDIFTVINQLPVGVKVVLLSIAAMILAGCAPQIAKSTVEPGSLMAQALTQAADPDRPTSTPSPYSQPVAVRALGSWEQECVKQVIKFCGTEQEIEAPKSCGKNLVVDATCVTPLSSASGKPEDDIIYGQVDFTSSPDENGMYHAETLACPNGKDGLSRFVCAKEWNQVALFGRMAEPEVAGRLGGVSISAADAQSYLMTRNGMNSESWSALVAERPDMFSEAFLFALGEQNDLQKDWAGAVWPAGKRCDFLTKSLLMAPWITNDPAQMGQLQTMQSQVCSGANQ